MKTKMIFSAAVSFASLFGICVQGQVDASQYYFASSEQISEELSDAKSFSSSIEKNSLTNEKCGCSKSKKKKRK